MDAISEYLDQFRKERNELTSILVAAEGDDLNAVVKTIIEQRDQWKALAEKFRKYAAHLLNCDERSMRGPCHCGYRQVIAKFAGLNGD